MANSEVDQSPSIKDAVTGEFKQAPLRTAWYLVCIIGAVIAVLTFSVQAIVSNYSIILRVILTPLPIPVMVAGTWWLGKTGARIRIACLLSLGGLATAAGFHFVFAEGPFFSKECNEIDWWAVTYGFIVLFSGLIPFNGAATLMTSTTQDRAENKQ